MKQANIAPVFACIYPGLADIARKHGYALAVHGSVVTDLDLIAIPWTDQAIDAEEIKNILMEHVSAMDYLTLLQHEGLSREHAEQVNNRIQESKEEKPHGRLSWNLYLGLGAKIDLSVMPKKS
jgi:hypothetical protein